MQQNAFSKWDYNCPLSKTLGMMKCIVRFFDNAKRVINESMKNEKKISWALINNSIEKQFLELSQLKFIDPKTPKDELANKFTTLCDDIDNEFRKLVLG